MTKRAPTNHKSFFSKMTLAAFAVAALSGCGREGSTGSAGSLTAPSVDTQGMPQFADAGDGSAGSGDPSTQWVPINDQEPAAVTGVNATVTGEVLEVSQLIPKSGGSITVGRHTLKILPNTFKNDTMITLRDLTGMTGRVECEILPADLALSKAPHLTSNFADLMSVAGCAMFEISSDGGSETWQSVGGAPVANGVKASIPHFGHFAPSPTN